MKKKISLKTLKVTSFVTEVNDKDSETVKGGFGRTSGAEICSLEPEFCNWTYNDWCWGSDDTQGGLCTAPK